MPENTLWDIIKKFYKEELGIPDYIVECISLLDVIKRCISGYSNYRISQFKGSSINYIKEALSNTIAFEGWDQDLDFNPLALYNRSEMNYARYKEEVNMVSVITSEVVIKLSFNLCELYYRIIEEIEKYDR
jgi:hypothetical protein